MILDRKYGDDYVIKFKRGEIEQGLGIGIPEVDQYLCYKQSQLCIINGLDNVGKTSFMLWYFLLISIKWDKKFILWCGENKVGQQKRDLVQFLSGKSFDELNEAQINKFLKSINRRFEWIDNKQSYSYEALYNIFEKSSADCCLIDPFTGLERAYDHGGNYDFLNASRAFVNKTDKTVYVNTHVNTEAARRMFPKNSNIPELEGYPMPPEKSNSEGGQSFANRPDDFITIHRYTDHPTYWMNTLVFVRKVKDTGTGGKVNFRTNPLIFDYNKGFGFKAIIKSLDGSIKSEIDPLRVVLSEKFGYNQESLTL